MPRKRVLIADDDDVFLKLLCYEFERRDSQYEVVGAENGVRVIELVRERQPDLLVLDIRMPVEDGFQVLEQLRELGSTFPVVVMTHFKKPEYEDRARELGAHDFIVKSDVHIGELANRVAAHL